MKKISIVLAILAVFLVFSCSNAAGPVDNAGNPVDLAGSWSGTVAYKADKIVAAPAIFTKLATGVDAFGKTTYTDFQGTWVKKDTVTKANKDYDVVSYTYDTNVTTTTTKKYIFNDPTVTTTEKRVVSADGSFVQTQVVKTEYLARAAITPVASVTTGAAQSSTTYIVDDNTQYTYVSDNPNTTVNDAGWSINGSFWNVVSVIPAQLAGVKTVTTTKTGTVTKQADNFYTEAITTKVETTETGAKFSSPNNNTPAMTVETYTTTRMNLDVAELSFEDSLLSSAYEQTVKVDVKKQVEYKNDVTETITFVVAKDGTYTITSVMVETQAAADAAAETATHYAAAARKASTKTTTNTVTGTVAAWEVAATANDPAKMMMVLSSGSAKTEVVGTEDFKKDAVPTVAKFTPSEYEIRFFIGEAKKEETAKTRMYVKLLHDTVVVLDKAVEAEAK